MSLPLRSFVIAAAFVLVLPLTSCTTYDTGRATEESPSEFAQRCGRSADMILYCGSDDNHHYFFVSRIMQEDLFIKIKRQASDSFTAIPFSRNRKDWINGRDFY